MDIINSVVCMIKELLTAVIVVGLSFVGCLGAIATVAEISAKIVYVIDTDVMDCKND